MILAALLPAFERAHDLVGLEQGLEFRIVLLAQRRYGDRYLAAAGIPVAADERERRIAAHHLAVIDIKDAAARTVHRMHLDLVKSLSHYRSGPHSRPATCSLRGHATTSDEAHVASFSPDSA